VWPHDLNAAATCKVIKLTSEASAPACARFESDILVLNRPPALVANHCWFSVHDSSLQFDSVPAPRRDWPMECDDADESFVVSPRHQSDFVTPGGAAAHVTNLNPAAN